MKKDIEEFINDLSEYYDISPSKLTEILLKLWNAALYAQGNNVLEFLGE